MKTNQDNQVWIDRAMAVLQAFFILLLVGCSGDEEDTTPSYADLNGFIPAENDHSATAELRREFYKQTGCYLLFSDTLTTQTSNGKPEMLDIQYSIIGTSSYYDYTYDYIKDVEQQRQAVEAVKKFLLPRLGSFRPFSILLVNDMYYDYYGRLRQADKMIGLRTFAISMGEGAAYEDPEGYFGNMLRDIIRESLSKLPESVLEPFFAYSNEYYGNDCLEKLTDQEVWDMGMFYYIEDVWWGDYFYYKDTDTSLWLDAVLTMSRDEFEAEYGTSAVMMEKYDILRQVILDQGFIIE